MSAATRSAPRRIDRYVLEHELGRGGMGVVYAAWDTRLERRVALKVLPPGLAADPGYVARFEQEMRIAGTLEHPHVVPVHEVGREDGNLFMVMRLVDGADLRTVLRREGPLSPERTGRIVRQVGGALDAAHARGLIHRDVKPANVLLTGEGQDEHAYLVDFGLAREAATRAQLTAPGEWIGTLDYAAPEQIAAVPLRPAADIYALGCLAFHLLTGNPPFAGSIPHVVHAHTHEPFPSVGGPLAAAVDPVLARATDKDPARRHVSAGDLGRELDAALRGAAPAAAPRDTDVTRAAAVPAAGRARRPPRAILLAGGLAVALGALAAVLLTAGGGDPSGARATGTSSTKGKAAARHRAVVRAPATTPYTAPAGGYTADVPSGDGWVNRGEQRLGAILRTRFTGPAGAELWIDATPQVAPTFGTQGRTQITNETYTTPVGTVHAYRFRGIPAFCAGGCLDDQLDLGGHGFAVIAGPTPQARLAARTTMRSLRPGAASTPTTTAAAVAPTTTAAPAGAVPAGKPGKTKPGKQHPPGKAKKDDAGYMIVTTP